ncbi:RNA-binding S4 domain-containing protein [Chrysiogenes arsenatis]|uniref:RNA-binding S4 domain-containing protein n=1 Tax=Chrysiogenes arsenatis TaxID=309797 RepID=UPI000429F787|nr:RNA-binding S4 domain-containing protein [Chrysiogenes arsenatis]
MRLDLFLKKSRLIKRRSVAKQMCDNGLLQVNGKIAKAGTKLKVGDTLMVDSATRLVEVTIAILPEGNVRKENAATLYTLLRNETKKFDIADWFNDDDDDEF